MSDNTQKLAQRLADIIKRLYFGERLSTKTIAQEYGVSIRTAQNDIERLSVLPLEKEGDAYYLDDFFRGTLSFDDVRNFATVCGMRELFPSLDDGFIRDILNEKISRAVEVRHLLEKRPVDKSLFERLSAAIYRRQVVAFTYNDKYRIVHPYKLVHNNGVWYLLGMETKLKYFALSKIKRLEVMEDTFEHDASVLALMEKNETRWISENVVEVQLQVHKSIAEYFLRKALLHNQTVTGEDSQYLYIDAKIAFENEFIGLVKFWTPYVLILSPQRLQEQVNEDLLRYLKFQNISV
jgi:predicted DNA-binding transcriptional regulator YafY